MKSTRTVTTCAGSLVRWAGQWAGRPRAGQRGWGPGLTLPCLPVGNKNDDPERKVVETEDAYKFAGQMGIQLFETSAKENVNVEEVRPAPEGMAAQAPGRRGSRQTASL